MTQLKYALIAGLLLVTEGLVLAQPQSPDQSPPFAVIDRYLDQYLEAELRTLIKIPTYRAVADNPEQQARSEATIQKNLILTRDYLIARVQQFNQQQKTIKLRFFEWPAAGGGEVDGSHRWVFGIRLGQGDKKIALITHLDTVGPGADSDWKPFEPRFETRQFQGAEQRYMVGRGSIDNKGPAVVALNVLKAVAHRYDETTALAPFTLELLFDTAEETDMAMPHYLKDATVKKPDMGVVFDAMWCIRAEKGIERPTFYISSEEPVHQGLWLQSLQTSTGPVNQIPGKAVATIRGANPAQLTAFVHAVETLYENQVFDDPAYRRAKLQVMQADSTTAILTTLVSGAQHGSAPVDNRREGANPLVSLANFVAHLVKSETLESSRAATLAEFVRWTWGTRVLGEGHPEQLQRWDSVFEKNNGTTYALTQFQTGQDEVRLNVDIRYASSHQQQLWDGRREGLMKGPNQFADVFTQLVAAFNRANPNANLQFATKTLFTPDIRNPKSDNFSGINAAFRAVTKRDCPMRAIGGGTDAKGHPELIAAGALFDENMGYPVNFHGIDEAAPWSDLQDSARILYQFMVNEIEKPGLSQ